MGSMDSAEQEQLCHQPLPAFSESRFGKSL